MYIFSPHWELLLFSSPPIQSFPVDDTFVFACEHWFKMRAWPQTKVLHCNDLLHRYYLWFIIIRIDPNWKRSLVFSMIEIKVFHYFSFMRIHEFKTRLIRLYFFYLISDVNLYSIPQNYHTIMPRLNWKKEKKSFLQHYQGAIRRK